MKHFTETDWVLLINQQVAETERMEMEDHLFQCHICFKKYLKVTENSIKSNKTASKSAFADFLDRIIKMITAEKKLQAKKKALTQKNNFIIYYTAVACLTLFFTGSGIFNLYTSSIPQAASQVTEITKQTEDLFENDWTEWLLRTEIEFKPDLKFLDWSDYIGQKE